MGVFTSAALYIFSVVVVGVVVTSASKILAVVMSAYKYNIYTNTGADGIAVHIGQHSGRYGCIQLKLVRELYTIIIIANITS